MRMCTYLSVIVLRLVDGQWAMPQQQPRPINVFQGEGNVLSKEQHLYDSRIQVLFHKKGVVDGPLMQKIYGKWEDLPTTHFFALIPEHCTSLVQWLDLFWFHVLRHTYSELFQTEVEQHLQRKKGKLCAKDRRVLVKKLIGGAHASCLQKVRPNIVKQFTALGYINYIKRNPANLLLPTPPQ